MTPAIRGTCLAPRRRITQYPAVASVKIIHKMSGSSHTIMTDCGTHDLPPLQAVVQVPEHVLMRQVGGEVVMLNLAQENYYGLNDVGARLMQIAETGATLGRIVEQLLAEFDAGREQIESDVRRIAADLIAAGLIEQVPTV